MAEIHLTDVPSEVWQSLVSGARRSGRTLEQEILSRLQFPPRDFESLSGQEVADLINDGREERSRRVSGLGEDGLDDDGV